MQRLASRGTARHRCRRRRCGFEPESAQRCRAARRGRTTGSRGRSARRGRGAPARGRNAARRVGGAASRRHGGPRRRGRPRPDCGPGGTRSAHRPASGPAAVGGIASARRKRRARGRAAPRRRGAGRRAPARAARIERCPCGPRGCHGGCHCAGSAEPRGGGGRWSVPRRHARARRGREPESGARRARPARGSKSPDDRRCS